MKRDELEDMCAYVPGTIVYVGSIGTKCWKIRKGLRWLNIWNSIEITFFYLKGHEIN